MPSSQHQCAHIPLPEIQHLERGILWERVKAGMDRAHRQGKQIGRPKGGARKGFIKRFNEVLKRLNAGDTSCRKAARQSDIGYATLKRLLDSTANHRVA